MGKRYRSCICVPILLASIYGGALAAAGDDEEGIAPAGESLTAPGPRLLTDLLVVGAMTGMVTVLNPDVRAGIARDGSLDRVLRNFASPIRRARQGAREDDDHFIHNYVAHPVSWGAMGLYMKERGHSNLTALVFTQLHSIGWEYVIEGSFQKPSGTDLVTNFTSAAVAIFLFHDLSERAARRQDKRLHHHLLTALNPLRPLRGLLTSSSDGSVAIVPTQIEGTPAVALRVGL